MSFHNGRAADDVGKQEGKRAGWKGWWCHHNRSHMRSVRLRRCNCCQGRRSVIKPVEGEILGLAKIHPMQRTVGRAIGFPIPVAAGLPLLTSGEVPSGAGKRECRRACSSQANQAAVLTVIGLASRSGSTNVAPSTSAVVRAIRLPFATNAVVRDVMVGVYGGFGKCASGWSGEADSVAATHAASPR